MKLMCRLVGHNYAFGTIYGIKRGELAHGRLCVRCGHEDRTDPTQPKHNGGTE